MHAARPHKGGHPQDVFVLVPHHLRDHVLGVAEPGQPGVEPHDLTEAPGGTLERRTPVARDRRIEPLVLVRSRLPVAAGGAADPRMGRVEAPPGTGVENVAFEKDGRASVRQETAAGGLDGYH